MSTKTSRYDAADYLASPEDIEAYLEAALEENDPTFFQKALGTVARAKGMQAVASKSHSTRAGLYKALSTNGNPEFATVYRVVQALGYRLAVLSEKKKARPTKPVVPVKPLRPKAVTKRTAA